MGKVFRRALKHAGLGQQVEFFIGDIDQVAGDIHRNCGSTEAVLRVVVIVLSSQVVEESEVFHHPGIGPGALREQKAVMPDA